jgi:hypothetical protein
LDFENETIRAEIKYGKYAIQQNSKKIKKIKKIKNT